MIRSRISVDRVLEVLNRAIEADPEAMHNLIEHRVYCNDKLAVDPDIQVAIQPDNEQTVGLLGILNGLFGNQSGWGAIAAKFELKCSQDSQHELKTDQQLLEDCPVCGARVIIGNLREFVKSPSTN